MIESDLIAVIYQRIDLVYAMISENQIAINATPANDSQASLDRIRSGADALKCSLEQMVLLPQTQFASTMADVENACREFEIRIKEI